MSICKGKVGPRPCIDGVGDQFCYRRPVKGTKFLPPIGGSLLSSRSLIYRKGSSEKLLVAGRMEGCNDRGA